MKKLQLAAAYRAPSNNNQSSSPKLVSNTANRFALKMRTAAPQRDARLATVAASTALKLFVCLAVVRRAASDDESYGARRTVFYQDNFCRLEAFREYAYKARAVDPDRTVRRVNFGECYTLGTTGAITTCNVENGTSTVETFLDHECTHHIYSSSDSPQCENLKVAGETCPLGGPASSSTDCANMRPYESITPGFFNLVGSPYADEGCTERTGGDHIISGAAFGVGNRVCSQSTLVRGDLFSLSECLSDGTVYAKVYGKDDILCAGEMYLEVLMFPGAVSSAPAGGICALGEFEDGRKEYYRVMSCTTQGETDKVPIGPTPAPTPFSPSAYEPAEPDPAPIDYRGDGDDEDLRPTVSSDNDSMAIFEEENIAELVGVDDDDDEGHNKDDDDEGHNKDDDDEGHNKDEDDDEGHNKDEDDDDEGHNKDDGMHGSSSSRHHDDCDDDGDEDGCDGDRETRPGGGEDDDGHHHHSHDHSHSLKIHLSSNEIFAIVFGISVALAIVVLSAVLSLGGASGAKVGPKRSSNEVPPSSARAHKTCITQ